ALGAACGRILKENRVDAAGLLVAGAGRSEQVVLDGPVASLQERISRWEGSSALMLVTGPVTRSEARLDWLTRRPLHGRTIVITRPDEEGTGLGARLSQAGAQVINCPTIGIEPLSDTDYLDRALLSLKEYQWVILTSANGARIFFRRLKQLNLDARALASARVAAIGPATAAVILASGIRPDCIPEEYRAEGLVKALADLNLAGARVLLPRASVARDLLPAALKQQGAVVDVVPTYRTIRPTAHAGEVVRALKAGDVDAVTFTSSSTVRNFVGLFRAGEAARLCREGGAIAACIGPVTAATARSEGLAVGVEAATSTLAGLVAALSSQFLPPAHAS
ncbi:MAG: uroporphyrinogen-III synthase, partial [Acidobacteriota bacterium]